VYKSDGSAEWFQVKSAVDGRQVASIARVIEPSKTGGPSILQGLYRTWTQHRSRGIKIVLVTNRPPAADDPILTLRDGKDGTVVRRLREVSAGSRAGRLRAEVASHLGVADDSLLQFLADLSFRIGRLETELRNEALPLMYADGLRHDDEAVGMGISLVRQLVTDGKPSAA